ncbi:Pinin [Heterocephalus glaber]|uniref:Pinin n=1 Tax=Heterocephalus glaber TaxID=10181 RepID=G5AU83_HETGA|nr:Pinin [Heterocephalus glaber]
MVVVVRTLQKQLEKAKESLKHMDENICKLTQQDQNDVRHIQARLLVLSGPGGGRCIKFAEQINKMEARHRRQSVKEKEKEHQVVRNEDQKAEQEEGKVAQGKEELEETGNQLNDVEIEEAGE